jgi:hypothetical protein
MSTRSREGVLRGAGRRAQDRRGIKDEKGSPSSHHSARYHEPTVCDRCGAVYVRKTWRLDHPVTSDMLEKAHWNVCPPCGQRRTGIAYGRVVVSGDFALEHEEEVRRRIANVAARARFTQPERRTLTIEREGKMLEVLTTSQKLAHRIVKELKKLFGGKARYEWDSRDGSLYATWTR